MVCSICGRNVMCDNKKHKEFDESKVWRDYITKRDNELKEKQKELEEKNDTLQ